MGTIPTHLSIAALYFLFPENLNLFSLAIAAVLPDIEYIPSFILQLIRHKKFLAAYKDTSQGFLHSILGSLLFTIPAAVLIAYLLFPEFSLPAVILSAAIGTVSHLLLDLPGHRELLLFYPYVFKNPLKFRWRFGFIERFYPWRNREDYPLQYISEFNWIVFSHIFILVSIVVVSIA